MNIDNRTISYEQHHLIVTHLQEKLKETQDELAECYNNLSKMNK